MSIRERVQDAMKEALKSKDQERLETLRMVKGALLLKEKEGGGTVSDEEAISALRGEVRKRRQTIDILKEHGKTAEQEATEREIAVIESFLPQQLSEADLEKKVREYVAAHPEITNAGRLTGALKKELGDLADGKMLNEVCRKVLEG